MRMLWCLPLFSLALLAQTPVKVRKMPDPPPEQAHKGGPAIKANRELGVTPNEVLAGMFGAMQQKWFGPVYEKAKFLEYRLDLSAQLPAKVTKVRGAAAVASGGTIDFDIDVDGVAQPNGQYRNLLKGNLGDVMISKDARRTLISSDDFKSFSDTPNRSRDANANLTNWRSYFLKNLNAMRAKVLDSGTYKLVYKGTGIHQGQVVDLVQVYKPDKAPLNHKQPINLKKIWTFWQDGGYEVWVYRDSKLPAAVFYTNSPDYIYANLTIDYDKEWRPKRIAYNNNSVEQEGSGDLVVTFDRQGMISGFSLKYDGSRNISLRISATMAFRESGPLDAFRTSPPIGYRKVNRDHLKLMILTQVSGGLLDLKKHGVNLRNFKF